MLLKFIQEWLINLIYYMQKELLFIYMLNKECNKDNFPKQDKIYLLIQNHLNCKVVKKFKKIKNLFIFNLFNFNLI